MGIHATPSKIIKAGQDIERIAAEARQRTQHLLDPSSEAASAHPGWSFSHALQACQSACEPHIDALIRKTATRAHDLQKSGRDIDKVDKEAAHNLTKVFEDFRADTF